MIKGIGTDIVSITRIENALARHGDRFAKRILGPDEYSSFVTHKQQANFLAKRFAAKEAVAKALGTGFANGVSWQDIQLSHYDSGQPKVSLSNAALAHFNKLKGEQVLISLSDELELVSAYVIFE